MYTYKLKDENFEGEATVPGFGVTVNGVLKCQKPFENPNFVLVSGPEHDQAPAAGHVTGVAPQNQQPQAPATLPEQPAQTAPAVESDFRL